MSSSAELAAACAAVGEEEAAFEPPPQRDLIFRMVALGIFWGQLGFSILSPFFPDEAKAKDVRQGVVGWIFSIFEVTTTLGTPLAMRLMMRVGAKPLLVASNALGGFTNILVGLTWYVDAGPAFVGACLALRGFAGTAYALASVAGYGLLPTLFGAEVSTATGTIEGVNGLALILGPIVGSSLFTVAGGADKFGYVVPFVCLGALEVAFSLINACALPRIAAPVTKQPSLVNFSWKATVPCVAIIVSGVNLGLLGPTLEPHLAAPPLKFSVQTIGFVFAVSCAAYGISAPAVGAFDDYFGGRFAITIIALGNLIAGLGYGWLAPPSLDSSTPGPSLTAAGCWCGTSLIGLGCSLTLIPVYKLLLKFALHDNSDEKELATAGLFTIVFSIGNFLGPTLGGVLSEAVGVQVAYTYSSMSLLALFVVLTVLSCLPTFKTSATASAGQQSRDVSLLACEGGDLASS